MQLQLMRIVYENSVRILELVLVLVIYKYIHCTYVDCSTYTAFINVVI